MSGAILEVQDLCYRYPDGTEALRGVSFDVAAGRAVALVGANGAGKSTLLMHLNGYLTSRRGEIRVGETRLTAETAEEVRRKVGVVFQDPDDQLFMPTVLEDVAFGPLNAGVSAQEAQRLAAAAMERVGVSHLKNRPPHRLSAGEKRAAAIATALVAAPDILAMDEPSANLDPRGRRRLIELLRSFEQTRVIATHDLELVVEVCAEVIVLDTGRIAAQGPTADLLNDERLMLKHGLERPHILRHRHPHADAPPARPNGMPA